MRTDHLNEIEDCRVKIEDCHFRFQFRDAEIFSEKLKSSMLNLQSSIIFNPKFRGGTHRSQETDSADGGSVGY
jgi:hypothetical protein